jgi:Major Facilitator Superfamily.
MSLSLMFALVGGKLFEINNLYVLIVAAISGMGEGFYWYSSNTLSQIVSIPETRAKFLSINGIFTNISSLLAPLLANLIIDFCPNDDMAYRYILGLVIVLYIFVIFVAQKLRLINEDKNISVLKTLSLKVDSVWAKHQLAVFLYGLKESLTLTLTGILVFNAVGSGGLYSKLQGVFAFITIVSFRLLSRVLDKSKINKTFNIGTFITIVSTLV